MLATPVTRAVLAASAGAEKPRRGGSVVPGTPPGGGYGFVPGGEFFHYNENSEDWWLAR